MAQNAKFIDVTKTFLPIDPRAFPESMHGTRSEDYPNDRIPVSAYEGYNFMPTSYGYRSYFGTNAKMAISALTSRCDKIFILQTNTYVNKLIALCEDGIWMNEGTNTAAWVHKVVLPKPDEGMHKNWSTAVISDELYAYRQGEAAYWKWADGAVFITEAPDPTVMATPTYSKFEGASLPIPAGSYTYQVVARSATGKPCTISAPTTVVLANNGLATVRFAHIPYGVGGYRLYRTGTLGTVYKDIPFSSLTTESSVYDDNTGWTIVSMPDTTLYSRVAEAYDPYAYTPNFLNMVGQIGLFRAGGRLGFWDSDDSIAWSNLDDFTDFTPSIETLAGSAKFEAVKGRITTIRPSGEGFVIYSSKSIVRVAQSVQSTFQWDPTVILSDIGIAFPEQSVAAVPDTYQFAYTPAGLYRIEGVTAEAIVPEITDFLKDSTDPIFLDLLEGRFLTLKILDPAYINGLVQFTEETVKDVVYEFPGVISVGDGVAEETLTGNDFCSTLNAFNDGTIQEIQQDGEAARVAAAMPQKQDGTFYQPLYTCYLAGYSAPEVVDWEAGACGASDFDGNPVLMSPKVRQASSATQTTAGKTAAGPSTWLDGNWTMERFVQVQTAIWELEEKGRKAFLDAVRNRAFSFTKTVNTVHVDGIPPNPDPNPPEDRCDLGSWIAGVSPNISFGYNRCSFWLTRYITHVEKFTRVKADYNSVGNEKPWWQADAWYIPDDPELHADPQNICDWFGANIGVDSWGGLPQKYVVENVLSDGTIAGRCMKPTTFNTGLPVSRTYGTASSFDKTTQRYIHNEGEVQALAVPLIESPFCVITGYKYTDTTGVERVAPANAACATPTAPANPDDAPNGSINGKPAPNTQNLQDGTFCSKPFDPITIPGISPNPIVWPGQAVSLPPSSFLLQNGSIGPIYPTYEGMLVYDLQLKKWGKAKLKYKQLLDYSPINTNSGEIISSETFGINAGALLENGFLTLFDRNPSDSYIRYGKIGYYRLGFTTIEEVKVHFRTPSTGQIEIQTSLSGRAPETMLTSVSSFTAASEAVKYGGFDGRWHSVAIKGNYDIQYVEYRGVVRGRR